MATLRGVDLNSQNSESGIGTSWSCLRNMVLWERGQQPIAWLSAVKLVNVNTFLLRATFDLYSCQFYKTCLSISLLDSPLQISLLICFVKYVFRYFQICTLGWGRYLFWKLLWAFNLHRKMKQINSWFIFLLSVTKTAGKVAENPTADGRFIVIINWPPLPSIFFLPLLAGILPKQKMFTSPWISPHLQYLVLVKHKLLQWSP